MKKPRFIRISLIFACTFIFLGSTDVFCASLAEQLSSVKFILPPPDSVQTQTYLGLDDMKPFKVTDIRAKIAVIELMNTLCLPCQANAPIMNDVYKKIQADSGLADVKVIVVAISDSKSNVETFEKQCKTLFPILPDEDGQIARSMPDLTIPTTVVVSTGDAKVLFTHKGPIADAEGFVKQLKFVKQLEAWDKGK